MKKILILTFCLGSILFSKAQSLQNTEKGLEFIQLLEMELEGYYGHNMKNTPSYEEGVKAYAFEKAGKSFQETSPEKSAHYHTSIILDTNDFEIVDNCQLVEILAPDDDMNGQIKELLTIIDPNRFYVESFTLDDKMYIVLALDRPFNYETWRAEE
jgi:hypothetical protein